jgi:hypothetical protein
MADPQEFYRNNVLIARVLFKNTLPAVRAVSVEPIGYYDPEPSSGFIPVRVIMNLAFEKIDSPGKFLVDLEEEVEVQIPYNMDDYRLCGNNPELGFFIANRWVRCTLNKHRFVRLPTENPAAGGVLSITINKWADPPLGIGR